jgi:DNA adenine methylase
MASQTFKGSIVKWPGSKRLILSKILRKLPKSGDVLVDAFTGSGCIALNTDYKNYYLNDLNADLISMYELCRNDPSDFIKLTQPYFKGSFNNKDSYLSLRDQFNISDDQEERGILLFVLSRFCFNSLVRYNKSNLFNTPFGSYPNHPYFPENEIYFFSEKLENATFTNLDFEEFIDFVVSDNAGLSLNGYFDPPYLRGVEDKPVFTQYTNKGFNLADHIRLDMSLTKHADNFDVIIASNHESKQLKTIYKGAKKTSYLRATRTISCKARNPAKEVILEY